MPQQNQRRQLPNGVPQYLWVYVNPQFSRCDHGRTTDDRQTTATIAYLALRRACNKDRKECKRHPTRLIMHADNSTWLCRIEISLLGFPHSNTCRVITVVDRGQFHCMHARRLSSVKERKKTNKLPGSGLKSRSFQSLIYCFFLSNKKLSCRREAARAVSLKILLRHSRSFEITQQGMCKFRLQYSIATTSLEYCTVSDIFIVE